MPLNCVYKYWLMPRQPSIISKFLIIFLPIESMFCELWNHEISLNSISSVQPTWQIMVLIIPYRSRPLKWSWGHVRAAVVIIWLTVVCPCVAIAAPLAGATSTRPPCLRVWWVARGAAQWLEVIFIFDFDYISGLSCCLVHLLLRLRKYRQFRTSGLRK